MGQKHVGRHDLLARVFARYNEEILRFIVKEKVLGETTGHFRFIEFQRRGLHQAHILLIGAPSTRPLDMFTYDRYGFAEIPDLAILPIFVTQL